MAIQTRLHGNVLPVFAIDQLGGSGTATTGVPVQIAGPKLEFFGMDLGADIAGQLGQGGAVERVIQCVTQLATTHMFQADGSGVFSIAVYPVAAWTASDLQAAIRALGTVNSYDLTGATVTNVGFKLAAS
jgi:hypothetical protein